MKKLVLFISYLTFFAAEAQTNVFTGGIDTNWNNPNNWSLVALPGPTNQVNIPTGKTVLLNVNTSVRSIHLEGTAVLIIQANLAISILQPSNTGPQSTISWGGGIISGGGTLDILGILDIIPGGKQIAGNTTLNLSGTMTQNTDWGIDIVDGYFNNMPNGVITLNGPQRNITGSGSGNHILNNYGLIKKTGTGTSTISAALNNTGIVTVESGSIILNSSQTALTNGTYNTFTGTSLLFGGTQTLTGTISGTNSGEIHWAGTMNVPVAANFNFSGNGLFNWGNGRLKGGGTLVNSGLLSMTGAFFGNKYIEDGTVLNNNGTLRIATDWSLDITNGTLNNTASGVIDFNISQVQILGTGTGSHLINNSGLIKKTLGTGTAQILAQLNNTGTISVEAGNITLTNPLTTLNGGVYNTSAGCYIFNSAPVTCSGTLTGVLDGNFNWTSDIIVPTSATFNFTGSGLNNWAAGSIRGGGTLTNLGTMELSPGWVGNKFLTESTTIVNGNTIRITSNQSITFNGGTINNLAGATLDMLVSGDLLNGTGTNTINNAGLLIKSASTGTYNLGPLVNNTGIIDANFGVLALGALNNTITGIVRGNGALQPPTAANFTNNGIFAPGGAPGSLAIAGGYQSTANTRLQVQLYGLTQGTQFDSLNIQGNTVMAGTVVPELFFSPAIGNTFIVANTWTTITSCNLASTATAIYNGQQYTFSVTCQDDNKVVLTVTQITLSNDEVASFENQILLAPNPAKNFISVNNTSGVLLNEVLISDASGRIIQTVKLDNHDNQIDLSGYSAGLYFMKLTAAEGSITKRFIVE